MQRHTLLSGPLSFGETYGSFPVAGGGFITSPTTSLKNALSPFIRFKREGSIHFDIGLGTTPLLGTLHPLPMGHFYLEYRSKKRKFKGGRLNQIKKRKLTVPTLESKTHIPLRNGDVSWNMLSI